MVNSGHSLTSTQYTLVHGVTKFVELQRLSELGPTHPGFKTLHPYSDHDQVKRKLHKILQKTGWYNESEIIKKTRWRQNVPKGWSGSKPDQYSVPGMQFSSVMYIPSSSNGRLLKMLAKSEPRLAKITGYQIKFIEKPGRNLSNLFSKEVSETKCYRESCAVCVNSDPEKPSKCQMKGVVYFGICSLCDRKYSERKNDSDRHEGLYMGETSQTLGERAQEHRLALSRLDESSFILKHWSTKHSDLNTPPPSPRV